MCSKCQTPLFFDFDGQIQTGNHSEEENTFEVHGEVPNQDIPLPEATPSHDPNFYVQEPKSFESDLVEQVNVGNPVDIAENYQQEELPESPTEYNVENNLENSEQASSEELIPTSTISHLTSTPDSTQRESMRVVAGEGPYLYTITISGVDSSRLRAELYEELKDPRWGWVALELMEQINQGQLVLQNVNAVKASLLLQRLKPLPIEITWVIQTSE